MVKVLWQITAIRQAFLPTFTISIALSMPIDARGASWFAVIYASTYTLTYAYMASYSGLSFMAIISLYSYSIAVATLLAVLPLYHQIPLYNKLTIITDSLADLMLL